MIQLTSNRKLTKEAIFEAARRLRVERWMSGDAEVGEWIMNTWTDDMIATYVDSHRDETMQHNLKWHIEEAAKIIAEYV